MAAKMLRDDAQIWRGCPMPTPHQEGWLQMIGDVRDYCG